MLIFKMEYKVRNFRFPLNCRDAKFASLQTTFVVRTSNYDNQRHRDFDKQG